MTAEGMEKSSRAEPRSPIVTHSIFLSYASADKSTADSVCQFLESHGAPCWMAPRDVRPGAQYADAIVRAINESSALVLVLSAAAVASSHVGREVERAGSKQKPLIAFRIDAAPLSPALEYFLSDSQWIDVVALGMPAALAKLKEAVGQGAQASLTPSTIARSSPRSESGRSSRKMAIAAAVLVVVGGAIALGVRFWPANDAKTLALNTPTTADGTSISTAPISDKSIAVLPFVDMSEKHDQEYFSDGLSEELIDLLTKVPDLRVPARTSSFYFKGKQATIGEIAKALNVAHVLEGSVRKSGNTLRVTAQLVRVHNGYHVWSQTYDRALNDIFKVQDEIADAVVKALKASLLEGGAPRSAPTSNIQAYTLYLQARKIWNGGAQPDFARASDYLRRALDIDRHFPQAWATLAQVRMDTYLYGEETARYNEVRAEVLESDAQALRLDPSLSDAHLVMARLLNELDWNWDASEVEFKQAIALDPRNSVALRQASYYAAQMGRPDEALRYAGSAIALDPLEANNYWAEGDAHRALGSLEKAESSFRKALELNDTGAAYHYNVGLILLAQGKPSAALELMKQETFPAFRQHGLILAYDALGRAGDADRELAAFEKEYAFSWAYSIVQVYAARRDMNRAFEWLERAYKQHDVGLLAVKTDPLLKNLASDSRYRAFLKKMNFLE